MSGDAVSDITLKIRCFHAHYRLPADHPDPEAVQRRMDAALTATMPEMLGSMTSSLESGDAIVLIRRLDLDLALNAGWDKARLARHWAQHILRELSIALHTEGDNGIVRYPNRAAFVSRFLADLAQGQAWGKWYYRQFEGLRMLPVSAALRTALCDPENGGAQPLLRLPERDLVKVLHILTLQDARRVLGNLARQDTGSPSADACLQVFLSLFQQRPDLALQAENDVSAALRLYIEAYREVPSLSGPLLMNLALATVRFARYLVGYSPAQGRELVELLTGGDKVALYRRFSAEAEHWMPLFAAPAVHIKPLGHLVLERCHKTLPSTPVPGEAPRYAHFGGLFLLLPLLDEFPISEITKDWPAPEVKSPSALLRLVLLLKCLGQPRTAVAFFDPVVRDFLAIAPTVTPTMLANWQGSLSEHQREAGLRRFRDWQHSIGIAGDENLVLARVPFGGGWVALLLDCAGGWLYAGERPESLARRLGACVPPTATRLLVDPTLAGSLAAESHGLDILLLDDERLSGLMQERQSVAETMARMDRLESEVTFLTLPKPFRGPCAADLIFSLMAHGLLRALARRLPGFARSTLPYLYDNFLDFGATVEVQDGRYLVRLEHPPLHIVLNMTGMARNHYRLSWLDGRVVELYQEG